MSTDAKTIRRSFHKILYSSSLLRNRMINSSSYTDLYSFTIPNKSFNPYYTPSNNSFFQSNVSVLDSQLAGKLFSLLFLRFKFLLSFCFLVLKCVNKRNKLIFSID